MVILLVLVFGLSITGQSNWDRTTAILIAWAIVHALKAIQVEIAELTMTIRDKKN